jgi:integrase
VIFLAETGCRIGEALHLKFADIVNGIWKLREKPMCPTKYRMGWAGFLNVMVNEILL